METNIHNDLFIDTIKNKKNARDFLKGVLPERISKDLDLSNIEYDDTTYIAKEFKEFFSDIVIKTKFCNKNMDIYCLIEHKSNLPNKSYFFHQILKYIYLMFTQDLNNNSDFRLILPIVFYHGKEKWGIPDFFIDIFDVPNNDIKRYLLNFSYVLFDTKEFDEKNKSRFGENLYLISVLIALKRAFYKDDFESVIKIIKNLNKAGYLENPELIGMLLGYILLTKNINKKKLIEIIYEENEQGGKKMITLTDIIREEALQEGKMEGLKEGERNKAIETARKMKQNGFEINLISEMTGLSKEEIEKL